MTLFPAKQRLLQSTAEPLLAKHRHMPQPKGTYIVLLSPVLCSLPKTFAHRHSAIGQTSHWRMPCLVLS
jgi:hypothetical protein